MRIFRVNDDTYCVKFTNVKGPILTFYKHVKIFRDDMLTEFNNVVHNEWTLLYRKEFGLINTII